MDPYQEARIRGTDEFLKASQPQEQANYGYAGTCGCDSPTGLPMPESRAQQIIRELSQRAYTAEVEGQRAKAALEFFEKHPEFTEFICLIRSGSISI
jgi:hypothetical protein